MLQANINLSDALDILIKNKKDKNIISFLEVLKIDEKISSMIFKKSDINELKTYLENINFKTILDDGKQKVEQKQTSLEEVYKVASF